MFALPQIERELQRLWKAAAEASTAGGGGPVVRACTMNLVAPCSNDTQFDHVAAVVEKLALRQPCRAILVEVDLDVAEPRIEAQASTVCSLGSPAQKRVCHEQIRIRATEGALPQVAAAVLGLLVPDVPAYVWAPCERLLALNAIGALTDYADCVVIDSHRFSEPFRALARASEVVRDHRVNRARETTPEEFEAGPGFGVLDLEWVRLQAWFSATATAFDRADAKEVLGSLHTLRVEYVAKVANGTPVAREIVSPALYAAWFSGRAGWAFAGQRARRTGEGLELRVGPQGQKRLVLVPRIANDRPGSLLGLEAAGAIGRVRWTREPRAEICVIGVELNRHLGQEAPGPGHSARVPSMDDLDALGEALACAPRDLAFEGAIPVALAFAPR